MHPIQRWAKGIFLICIGLLLISPILRELFIKYLLVICGIYIIFLGIRSILEQNNSGY